MSAAEALDPSAERWILRWLSVGVMVDHRIAQGRRQQMTAMARMPLLAAPRAALAIALAAAGPRSTLTRSFTGGWLGGIPGAGALLLLQLGDTGGRVP